MTARESRGVQVEALPIRIQRRRTKGWRMPEGAVYVGRPTFWGNPFAVGQDGVASRQEAVDLFRQYLTTGSAISPDGLVQPWNLGRLIGVVRRDLAGRDLACWCPLDQPCHADVLLAEANTDLVTLTDGGAS